MMIHSNESEELYPKHKIKGLQESSERNLHSEEALGNRYMNNSERSNDIFNSKHDSPVKHMYKRNKEDLLRSPTKRE